MPPRGSRLRQIIRVAPEWLRDSKFGIWIHFGPQSEEKAATGMSEKCTWRGHRRMKII